MQNITVAIAGRQAAAVATCVRLLRQEPDTEVVGQAATCMEIVATVRKFKPRVLVCSFEMCADTDYPLLLELLRECPATRVVLLGGDLIEEDRLMDALAIGARGYLGHEEIPLHLASAVRGVDQGKAWVPRKLLGKMAELALH